MEKRREKLENLLNQAFSIQILKILVGHWPTWPSYCDAPAETDDVHFTLQKYYTID